MSSMAHTTYDAKTFHAGVLPGGLEKESKTLIRYAVDLGWTVMVKHITVKLFPPNKVKRPTITISASNHNIPYQRHLKTIDKHGSSLVPRASEAKSDAEMEKLAKATADRMTVREQTAQQREEEKMAELQWEEPPPAKAAGFKAEQEKRRAERGDTEPRGVDEVVAEGKAAVEDSVVARVRDLMEERGEKQRELAAATGLTEDKMSKSLRGVRRFKPEDLSAIAAHYNVTVDYLIGSSVEETLDAYDADASEAKAERELEELLEAESAAAEKAGDRYIVKQGPLLAYAAVDKAYPSETTIEREWSDGTKDYKCRLCDKTSDNRRSLRSHYRVHVRAGEAEAPRFRSELVPIDPHEPVYRPRKSRVEALKIVLKNLLESGLDWNDPDNAAEALATAALEWLHEHGGEPSVEAEQKQVSDAEERLMQIRALLGDDPETARLRAQNEKQADRIETLEVSVSVVEAEAKKARDTLATFRALINEEVPEAG